MLYLCELALDGSDFLATSDLWGAYGRNINVLGIE